MRPSRTDATREGETSVATKATTSTGTQLMFSEDIPVTEAICRVLEEAIHARGDLTIQRLVEIDRRAPLIE